MDAREAQIEVASVLRPASVNVRPTHGQTSAQNCSTARANTLGSTRATYPPRRAVAATFARGVERANTPRCEAVAHTPLQQRKKATSRGAATLQRAAHIQWQRAAPWSPCSCSSRRPATAAPRRSGRAVGHRAPAPSRTGGGPPPPPRLSLGCSTRSLAPSRAGRRPVLRAPAQRGQNHPPDGERAGSFKSHDERRAVFHGDVAAPEPGPRRASLIVHAERRHQLLRDGGHAAVHLFGGAARRRARSTRRRRPRWHGLSRRSCRCRSPS